MNYDRIILELIDRISRLESEVSALKEELSQFSNSSEYDEEGNNISTSTARDTTKYILDGKRYGKNRLVLAVVHKYIESHPNISASPKYCLHVSQAFFHVFSLIKISLPFCTTSFICIAPYT